MADLTSSSSLCVSTGLNHPVCASLETRFARQKKLNRLTAEEGVAYSLWKGEAGELIAKVRASILLKFNNGERNGLITDGPFEGFWAHWIGPNSYFVARKNELEDLGPVHVLSSGEHVDHTSWEFVMNTFKDHLFNGMPSLHEIYDIIE